jgi:hypothetical protein
MATRPPPSDQDSTSAEPRPHEISSKVMMGAAEAAAISWTMMALSISIKTSQPRWHQSLSKIRLLQKQF